MEDGPGRPGAGHVLWWLLVRQRRRVAAGALFGVLSLSSLAGAPYLLSRAVDDGLVPGHWPALVGWTGALLAAGVASAVLGILRHRTMSRVRMDGAYRTAQAVLVHATRLGAALPFRTRADEVVAIGLADVQTVSTTLTIAGPGVGAVATYLLVVALMGTVSPLLAGLALLGVPLLAVLLVPLMRRMRAVESGYRAHQGALTARLLDVVGGLRVLAGLGGEEVVARRYRRVSRELRAEGDRVGAVASWIEALGTGLPVLFVGAVTWVAARTAAAGGMSVGDLLAVYGYAALLAVPVGFFVEAAHMLGRGWVAAGRVARFLALDPLPVTGAPGPPAPAVLHDPVSGVDVAPGRLTALVSARPSDSAEVVDRLGRYAPSAATWGGRRLDALAADDVRGRLLVADPDAALFAGPLREVVGGRAGAASDAGARDALAATAAQELEHGLPGGLDGHVDGGGRNLSGGQRQRLLLARALHADPEVLLAVEPTSALDVHTEAAVAAGLRAARVGRTTLVTTTSPLLLGSADAVVLLVGGRAVARGTHGELLADPRYRAVLQR